MNPLPPDNRRWYRRPWLLWTVTVVVTLASVAYQRLTGPTYARRGSVTIDDATVRFRLPRSWTTESDAEIRVRVPNADSSLKGTIRHRRYKSHDPWTTEPMTREADRLVAHLPKQPAAGKVMYRIVLVDANGDERPLTEEPVVLRFKGAVPATILAPHIALMFLAFLLGTRAGLEALAGGRRAYAYAVVTTLLVAVGGLVLGPIVQKYAFGAYWTGWPLGHDLTDNKVAVSFLFWIVALARGRRGREGRAWIVAAAAVQLLVYLIPHSVLGSEIDHTAPPE
jgi:hypothetical protein